jgi:glycolate oxidase FAD binding subunit
METLRPESDDALVEALHAALDKGRPLEVTGAATKRGIGRPVEADARLDVSALAGVLLYQPDELVLTARPATPLAEIEALLAKSRQRLAFEPPDLGPLLGGAAGKGTLGGAVACGFGGPRRPFAGSARDHLLGFKAVSGRAERFKSGGRVVKNVTGFDLSKLMAGSFGTLAVLIEVTVKVLPAPEQSRTLILRGLAVAAAVEAMTTALSGPYDVSGAAYLPEQSITALRLEGPGPSVEARSAALRQRLGGAIETRSDDGTFWRGLRDVAAFAGGDAPVWRLSLPPASAPAVVAALPPGRWYLDWGGGLLWYAGAGEAAAIRAALVDGGHGTLVRAPEELRRRVEIFQPQPPALAALSARVKEAFDPARILNRGRM